MVLMNVFTKNGLVIKHRHQNAQLIGCWALILPKTLVIQSLRLCVRRRLSSSSNSCKISAVADALASKSR